MEPGTPKLCLFAKNCHEQKLLKIAFPTRNVLKKKIMPEKEKIWLQNCTMFDLFAAGAHLYMKVFTYKKLGL